MLCFHGKSILGTFEKLQQTYKADNIFKVKRYWKNKGKSTFFYELTVLNHHSKIDKTKVLKQCGSLMQVKSTAESPTGAFCNTFDLHSVIIGMENIFWGLLLSGRFRKVLL